MITVVNKNRKMTKFNVNLGLVILTKLVKIDLKFHVKVKKLKSIGNLFLSITV
jgi:hypothetical protein